MEEALYYPSSENKGADQLRGYREADLRLCFRISRMLVFPRGGSYEKVFRMSSLQVAYRHVLQSVSQSQNSLVGKVRAIVCQVRRWRLTREFIYCKSQSQITQDKNVALRHEAR